MRSIWFHAIGQLLCLAPLDIELIAQWFCPVLAPCDYVGNRRQEPAFARYPIKPIGTADCDLPRIAAERCGNRADITLAGIAAAVRIGVNDVRCRLDRFRKRHPLRKNLAQLRDLALAWQ